MTNTSMMEKDKFGGYYFKLQRRIRRVETEKSIEMRKDEKKSIKVNKFGLVAFLP